MPAPLNPWTYTYIRLLADEATTIAKRDGIRPSTRASVLRSYRTNQRLNIPFIGDHIPAGWERTDAGPVFVDTTGRGQPGESAMTHYEFIRQIEEHGAADHGYGVIELGQTQALIATYRQLLTALDAVEPKEMQLSDEDVEEIIKQHRLKQSKKRKEPHGNKKET